jgi:omega-hydroxy-beta-dihydromenaquinone-9 sulfotransferase
MFTHTESSPSKCKTAPTFGGDETSVVTLDRPIFLVGSGRCGSTIIHKIFRHHPQVCFLNDLSVTHAARPYLSRWAMRLIDMPWIQAIEERRMGTGEFWEFWEFHLPEISQPCRDLFAKDVRPIVKRQVTEVLSQMLTKRRDRLLFKFVGWPRMGFLSEMFPGALFVHVVRDGRPVVNSHLNIPWWKGWQGPSFLGYMDLRPEYQREWEESNRSFVILAAIQWKTIMDAFEMAKQSVSSSNYLEIKYEDFAADPKGKFGDILEFCGLDYPLRFSAAINRFKVESRNHKWREYLTSEQQEMLTDSLRGHLERYGYIP